VKIDQRAMAIGKDT